jgi:hypothetical protein
MISEESAVTAAYLEHLSDRDLVLLAGPDDQVAQVMDLRRSLPNRRGGIEDLLSSPAVFDAIFAGGRGTDPLVEISPFLIFAVAVHRAVRHLESASYVPEWAGVGRRTPLFDVARLRQFLSSPRRRLFLAELLASYSHVTSGSVIVATRRGLRRHRFSELDPVRLAGLLEVVPDLERPGVLRRLGDVCLFLTGVFPDYLARHGFGPIDYARLQRAGGVISPGSRPAAPPTTAAAVLPADNSPVGLLEQLGQRWYRAAFEMIPPPVPSSLAVIGELPERFGDARSILERY